MTKDLTDFDGQEEVEISSFPSIKQFKKGDVFIGYLQAIIDAPLTEEEDNGMGGKT